MKNTISIFLAASLLLFSITAWSASTKEEIAELKAQITDVQKDLAEIKQLLKEGARAPSAAKPAFKAQVISIGDSPVKGQADATVTLVEYSDYQCPFCARNYRSVMPTLQKEYIDSGKLKFVMREYPLPQLHKNASNASQAAVCAGRQDKYWEMHNLLFDNQKELGVDNVKAYAESLGLDTAKFNTCLDSKESVAKVREDMASGAKLGMGGTPGFFLGLTDPGDPDKVELSVQIEGAQSIEKFKASIDALLESVE